MQELPLMEKVERMGALNQGSGTPPRVDSMRSLAQHAHRAGDAELLGIAWSTFESWTRDLLAFAPGDADLGRWQEMALDFEVALAKQDLESSAAARRLAAELRTAITMIERNPADKIAKRPTAVRVLRALAALGGAARLSVVREKSGLGATHLSNILKPLICHGLVTAASDAQDGRERRISLTASGLSAAKQPADGEEHEDGNYRSRIQAGTVRSKQFRQSGTVASSLRQAGRRSHETQGFRSKLAGA